MAGDLGFANATAEISTTGDNAGNWTATFTTQDIGISKPRFECYHIVIKGGPAGSTFDIYIGIKLWDSVAPGDTNSWDPNNTMRLVQGDTVYFYWNTGTGTTGPEVWMYFQDPKIL